MDGPRAPNEIEFEALVGFLDRNLRSQTTWSIRDEYPLALNLSNLSNMRIISDEKQILSHALVRPLIVRTPMALFKVALIGSVVTDPSHRNQGLSRQVLESCIDEAHRQQCDVAILWTDLFDFYRKLGFELAGSEISFLLDSPLSLEKLNLAEKHRNLKFMNSTRVAPEALLRLYNQHTVGVMRTAEDIRRFLSIPQTQVHTAWNLEGQLVSYAVEGKGADLKGYIHEWGGKVTDLLFLLQHIREHETQKLTLLVPSHSQNLITKLSQVGVQQVVGNLGMIKILRLDQISQKLNRAMRSLGLPELMIEKKEQGYVFGFARNGSKVYSLPSEGDLVRLMFGPLKKFEVEQMDQETRELIVKVFPVPFWIWGWDSV